jgi:RNA recognition motif-containing protein
MNVRLFVGDLPRSLDASSLSHLFSRAGAVLDAQLVRDRATGQPRGWGFVTMANDREALEAVRTLDHARLDGRPIRVRWARPLRKSA